MGFLRKGKNKSNAETMAVPFDAPKKTSLKKSLGRRFFGGSGKKSAKQKKEIHQCEKPTVLFQHHFVTVDAEENDHNNITIDSVESIMMTPDRAQKASQQQEEQQSNAKETLTEGTDIFPPDSTAVSVSDDSVYLSHDKHSNDQSSEKPPADIISVEENIVAWNVPDDTEEAKHEAAGEESTASARRTPKVENSMLRLDDDDITDRQSLTVSSQQPDGPRQRVERAAKAFLQGMTCTVQDMENCAALPTNLGGIAMPITACQPIINQQAAAAHGKANLNDPAGDYYDEMFAVEFLNDLLNVGFTLVHHTAVDDDDDWIGRTVNLNFKPGVCTSRRVVGPSVQWTTMGGGKDAKGVETELIGLFEIDAIAASNVRNELDPISSQQYEEELDCFFTMTSKQGDVYLFEAISPEESQRIVSGVKNISFRLSSQVIAGDSKVVADFFDNSKEPAETHLRKNAAMLKISNAYLDDVL